MPLAFLHVPKSAGSSLAIALERALHPASHSFCYDRVLFGTFDDFASLHPDVRRWVHLSPDDVPRTQMLTGHVSLSTIRRRYGRAVRLMTVLREPSCRLLSHWLFWRGHSDAQLAAWGSWAARVRLARLPLADFLAAPALACQNDNLALRMLLWPHRLIPDDGFINPRHDAALLAQARRALDRFDFTDVMESAGMPARLGHWLGCHVEMPVVNRTERLPDAMRLALSDALTPVALDRLVSLGRLDLQLWLRVARASVGPAQAESLRETALLGDAARFAGLLAPESKQAVLS